MKGFLWSAVAACALSACASRAHLSPEPTGIPEQRVHAHLAVPAFPDNTDQCGPSSLAALLTFWGHKVTPAELKGEVYVPKIQGTLPMDMKPALSRRGMKAQVISGTFEDIRTELRAGRPVIAYLDFGTRKHPIGHFLIVTGFNKDGLIVHSGEKMDKFASYRRFDRGWSDTDRWMLIARPVAGAPTGEMAPVSRAPLIDPRMSADDHYQLGQIYEARWLPDEAAAQYRAAIALNGEFDKARMALGNLAFAAGDYRSAEKEFRRVLRRNPDHGGANNNLAMVYLAEGKNLKKAEALAMRALNTDYRLYAEDTLARVRERLSS